MPLIGTQYELISSSSSSSSYYYYHYYYYSKALPINVTVDGDTFVSFRAFLGLKDRSSIQTLSDREDEVRGSRRWEED